MYIYRPTGRLAVRIIAIILIATFINQDLAWAQDSLPVSIPKNIASTKEVYKDGEKTIINIQDAHASLDAQESIAGILDSLVSQYDIKVIAIEGSVGYIDTSLLRTFPDEKAKKAAAADLMKQGKMSAAEFFAVTSAKPVALYGVEDQPLYQANVDQFRSVYEANKIVRRDLDLLSSILSEIKDKAYSDEIKELESNALLHRDGKISFSARWNALSSLARKAEVSYDRYADLVKLVSSLRLESKLDFEKANKERDALIDALTKKLPKKELEALVLKSFAFKSGKASRSEYYLFLRGLARDILPDPAPYKNLIAYTDYIILYESIDLVEMFGQIKAFEDAVEEKLFGNDDERRLHKFAKCAEFLKGVFELKLMGDDFDYLSKNLETCNAEAFAVFIAEASAKYGIRKTRNYDLSKIFDEVPKAFEFYRTAEKRNETLLANTIKRMGEEGVAAAALVTGGYHSKGIGELLKGRKMSYLVVLPKFDASKGERPYAAILTKKTEPYSEGLKTGQYHLATSAYFAADPKVPEGARFAAYAETLRSVLDASVSDISSETENAAKRKELVKRWLINYAYFYDRFMNDRLLRRKAGLREVDFTPRPPDEVAKFLRSLDTSKDSSDPLFLAIKEALLKVVTDASVRDALLSDIFRKMAEQKAAGTGLEVEKKFLLTSFPEFLKSHTHEKIVQGYLYIDNNIEIRIRQKGPEYFATVKTSGGLSRREVEIKVSSDVYNTLIPLAQGRVIIKDRYSLPLEGGLKAEVDIYYGKCKGLVTLETELPDAKTLLPAMPAGIGAFTDVTENKEYKNKTLALKGNPADETKSKEIGLSGLKKTAALGAFAAFGAAALSYFTNGTVATALGIAAGYFLAISIVNMVMHSYIATALGERAGPIAKVNTLPDGFRYIWTAHEFKQLPFLIRTVVMMHECIHLYRDDTLSRDFFAYVFTPIGFFNRPVFAKDAILHILSSPRAAQFLRDLDDQSLRDLLPALADLRGVKREYPGKPGPDVFDHVVGVLENLPEGSSMVMKLSALFHDIGKKNTQKLDSRGKFTFPDHDIASGALARPVLEGLGFDKNIVDDVTWISANHMLKARIERGQLMPEEVTWIIRDRRIAMVLELARVDIVAALSQNPASAELKRISDTYGSFVTYIELRKMLTGRPVTIAIDGPAGAGKTVAMYEIANKLDIGAFSSGKIFRLASYITIKNGLFAGADMSQSEVNNFEAILKKIDPAKFVIKREDGRMRSFYDQEDVTDRLEDPEVVNNASLIAKVPQMRGVLTGYSRAIIEKIKREQGGVVLEGRTTAIELVPDADLKIFLEADPHERARRRAKELIVKTGIEKVYSKSFNKGIPEGSKKSDIFNEIAGKIGHDMTKRDKLDEEREHMPLIIAEGAYAIDTTELTETQVVDKVFERLHTFLKYGTPETRAGPDSEKATGVAIIGFSSPTQPHLSTTTALHALSGNLRARFKAEVDVKTYDMYADHSLDVDSIAADVLRRKARIVGLSVTNGTLEKARAVFEKIMAASKEGDRPLIVLGGTLPNYLPDTMLREYFPGAMAVQSEGEIPLVELVEYVQGKRPLEDVHNLAFIRDGQIVHTARTEGDLLSFASPDMPELVRLGKQGATVYIESSRGCPWGACLFCASRKLLGSTVKERKWRAKALDTVVREIEALIDGGINYFYFADEEFFGPGAGGVNRARDLAKAIIALSSRKGAKIQFCISCRSDSIWDEEDDTELHASRKAALELLQEAGLNKVFLGVESGCQSQLDRFNKGLKVRESEMAIRLLRQLGVQLDIGFIMFDPESTIAEIDENLLFIERNNLLPNISYFLNHLRIQEGTPFAKSYKNKRGVNLSDRPNPNTLQYQYSYISPKVDRLSRFAGAAFNESLHYVLKSIVRSGREGTRAREFEAYDNHRKLLQGLYLASFKRALAIERQNGDLAPAAKERLYREEELRAVAKEMGLAASLIRNLRGMGARRREAITAAEELIRKNAGKIARTVLAADVNAMAEVLKPAYPGGDQREMNEGIFVIKAGGTFNEPFISDIINRIASSGYAIEAIRVLTGEELSRRDIFGKQHGFPFRVAKEGSKLFTQKDFETLAAIYDTPKLEQAFGVAYRDLKTVPAYELIDRYGLTTDDVVRLWERGYEEDSMHKNDVTGVNKIATGKYVLATSDSRVEGGKPFLMVNGLYLQIKSIDEKPGGKTVVFLVRGLPGKADSWKKMREELLGDKAPLHCPKGSIRNDAFRGNMNITEPVTFWRNIAHLSSGPFEGMLESLLWFGSRISHTALGGRLLQKGYSREEISFFLNDPEIALDGMRKPLFSWTEKMDTDQAVAFITRTMPPFYDDAAMPTISFKDYLRLSAFHDAGTLSVASNIVDAARIRQASVRIDDYPLRGSPENSRYTATGRHLIMDGKVAAVLLGGGTAGRWFGYDVPERMRVRLMADAYKIGGRMRSFAELKLGRIMWAAAEAGEKIPVWIMTSALIDNEIKQFVGNNGYFAMRSDDIHYYAEGEVPRMNPTRADLKAAFPDKPESWIDEKIGENGGEGGLFRLTGKGLSKKTMGHFDAIASLWLSKELLRMTDEGVEYIHFSDATNLGTNIDPVILGMLEASNNDVLHVLARKDDIFEIAVEGADKKFTVIMRGGRITYSSLPETLVPMVRQKDAQGAETVEIMERATGRPVKADVKKRLEKGGTLVDVDGKPQILEGFRFPREYNQSALPHFSTAHQIVRVKAILQLFGMSEEEYRKASRQELLTRIDAVASRLNTYVELKEVLDESAGKTRIGAQFSRLSGDLTALFDTGYVIIDRDGNESECAFLPYKDRVDLERNKEAALGVLLNRTVFSDADGFVSPELDKRYKELYLDFKNGDGLNPDGLEEARALFEKTREGALLLDSRGRPVPVKDDTYGAILSSGMFTPQAVFVLNRLRDEVDAALGPGIMRYAVDESAYHIALSMFQDVIGNTDEGTLTEEERTTLFKLFADSAASVTKGRPFRLKLEGLRVLPGGGVIAAWKDTGGLTAMRKEFSRRAIAVMGAKASRLADPKNIIHTTLLRILENLDKPTLSRLKGKVESYSDMSGADITVEVSAVDIIHETRRFLAESRTLRTIRLEGRAGKSVLPPQHIEKAGLARTAVGAALAGAVSAALAFALPDMQWLPAALLACAAYACTISIVSAATLFYIARVLGERAGPIAFYDPESNSILYLTADGTYTKDEGRSLLAALPAFIRTIVRLHERAHAGGYGDPAAYIAPLLGLFRGSAAILPGAAPKALEKRYTSKGVLSSPEGAEIDLGVLEKALNVAGRTLSKKLHADIVLSAAGSAFLLSLVKKAVPFDKVNDMDVEVNIHGEVASEMLIKELGHAVNRVLRSKGLEVRDLAFYDWRTIKGVLVADAPGQRRFCEVDFIIKHLEVPPSPYAIVMFHKEFLIKRFSAAGTMMWSEEASNNGQVTLKAVDPLADPRKYIVRYLRYEYFFGASEIFKKMALEYLETPFSGYGALAEKIGRSGRIEALTRALGGDLNKAAAPVKAPASSVIEEKEGREELFAKLRYLQGKLKHADGMSGPAAAALREDVIKVETEILERMARRKFVDDGAEEIIADLVSAGTERSDVQRALILYNRLQGRFISGLLDNYHIGDVPVRFKGARGISFMTGADGTFRNMFRDRSVMIVETHPDDIMINIATTAKLLKATAKRTLFVNALPDQTGVSDEYADGVDRSRLPASIDPNDRTAIKRWVRAEEARLGARLLGFDEKDYRPLNLDLPLEKGVYDRDGKLLSFESIFREPSPEDQEKADELVRNNPDIDTYLLIFPFSNHPHHRMVTNMMLKAIARYNKRAEIFFWEDDLEFKQHYIKQNVYLFHDQGEQSRKEGNIIEAYPSQNRRRGGEFYARQAVKASLNAAEAGYEDIRHQGEMKELELRAFKKKYPHAERLFKVDLVEPPSLGEQQRAGSNVGTAAVKSPGFDDPDLRRTYDDQLKTFMALPLKERSTILEESSVNSKAGGFEKIDGAFALDEKGQPIPVRGSDTYGIITSPDVFTPQAVARMNVLRDEVVSALPEKVRRYVIDESAYRIVASIFQDMVPSANPGVKIPQKKLEELFTAFLDVLEREAPADGLRIRLEGLRVNPNGGVIAVWQNDGTILRIRKAFAARAEEIIGIDAMESLRSKNIVHVTLLRILSDIDAETLGKLKKIVEKHDNLRDENIVVTIRRLNAYHETEWLRPAKHQILSSVDLGGLSAGRGEYERAMQQSLAKIFAKEALERKPRFMLALPASIKDKDVRKRALEAVKNAANELVSVAGRNVELGFFDQTGKKDVEGFSSFIARENVKGLYIDESFFEDKHQDAAAAEKALKEMAQAITAEASAIVIGSSTRKETEQIMTRIKKLLPKIERADIDKDAVLAELKTEVKLLRDALETRKRAVKQFYNGASIAAAMNSAVTRKGPIAIGLTATVVGNDLFSADDMEDVARNEKITPYFIFGSAAEGRKPVASIEEAKEYLRSCDYSETALQKIRYIDGKGLSYNEVAGIIGSETGLDAGNIGIAAIEKEFARMPEDQGFLLEVGAVEIGGKSFYATMNSIQTLLNIMANFNGASLDSAVPGVAYDEVKKVFRYLPRAVPIDYNAELNTYREAIKLIRMSA